MTIEELETHFEQKFGLSIEKMVYNRHLIPLFESVNPPLTEEFILKYIHKVRIKTMFTHQTLSEEFIKILIQTKPLCYDIPWSIIIAYQVLTGEFMEKYITEQYLLEEISIQNAKTLSIYLLKKWGNKGLDPKLYLESLLKIETLDYKFMDFVLIKGRQAAQDRKRGQEENYDHIFYLLKTYLSE